LHSLLRHIRGKVGDDRVRFVKFDGGAEFRTESAVQVYREWKLDFSVNCPTHHWQTGPVERGHSIHQNSMRTTGSFSDTPSVLWGQNYLLSVEIHNIKLHAGAAVCPYFDLTGLAPDTQFIYIWGCLAVVHNHSINPDKFYPRGLPCIYVGTGYFENVHGAKFLNPATGQFLFSTNMTVSEHFFPFKELVSSPRAVRDCFGPPGVWKLRAPLEGTRPAAMRWQSPVVFLLGVLALFLLVLGGHPPPDKMFLCTHVDDFYFQLLLNLVHRDCMLIRVCLMIANSSMPELLLVLILFGIEMPIKCIYFKLLVLIVCLSKNLQVSCDVRIRLAMVLDTMLERCCTNGNSCVLVPRHLTTPKLPIVNAPDSAPAIAISQGPTNRSRTKHTDFTMALARVYIQRGRAVLEHCPAADQIADV
jgi:hypothetical protein